MTPATQITAQISGRVILTAADVAAQLGVSKGRVGHMMRTGELPSMRVGKTGRGRRIPAQAFAEWLEAKNAEAWASVKPSAAVKLTVRVKPSPLPRTTTIEEIFKNRPAEQSPSDAGETVLPASLEGTLDAGKALLASLQGHDSVLADFLAASETQSEATEAQARAFENYFKRCRR